MFPPMGELVGPLPNILAAVWFGAASKMLPAVVFEPLNVPELPNPPLPLVVPPKMLAVEVALPPPICPAKGFPPAADFDESSC